MSSIPIILESTASRSTQLAAAATEEKSGVDVKARFVDVSRKRRVLLLETESGGMPFEASKLLKALFQLRVQVVGLFAGQRIGSVLRLRIVEFDGAELGRLRERELCRDLPVILARAHD